MSNYYQSAKHRAWREKVLRRDKYLCRECMRYGRKTVATHAHHVKERAEHPELQYVVDNGQSLCADHHAKKHPEKGGNRNGYV